MRSSHDVLAVTVPRYTSYPTAPHFHAGVDAATVGSWIGSIARGERLSLYLHVPFCDRLCWFCACHTRQTLRYEPVSAFLQSLFEEIRLIGDRVGGRAVVHEIHLGGGSPTMLRPEDLEALRQTIDRHFSVAPDCRLSVEIDPNDIDDAKLDALSAIGLTRASIGVQDFDAHVQRAINRDQSFETTEWVIGGVRRRGTASVNVDLLYGLPHQTVETLCRTIDQVLTLRPDRLALFGYAHVPWFKKHQTMIDEAALPGPEARRVQADFAADLLGSGGYRTIGIDHFVLPDDPLGNAARSGRMRRNFQGYTDDPCETLLGLGPSSISRYREGYAQNASATADYARRISRGEFATVKGLAVSEDDKARAWVIERLMCDFQFSVSSLKASFGAIGRPVIEVAHDLMKTGRLTTSDGDTYVIAGDQRHSARIVASHFDAYRNGSGERHSLSV